MFKIPISIFFTCPIILIFFHIYIFYFQGLTDDEVRKIREAINKASSLEEVERLQKILQSGQIPGHDFNTSKTY